jgi:general secretion pathway protein G
MQDMSFGRPRPPAPTCGTFGHPALAEWLKVTCGTLGGQSGQRSDHKEARGAPPEKQNKRPGPSEHHHSVPTPTIRSRSGFTLLELIVVIIVLGLLAGLVAPQIFGRLSEAKSTTARTQIELLATALDNYRLDNGAYPTTEQGLQALREKPIRAPVPVNWRGPYLRKDVPLDPWGRPYAYKCPGDRNATAFDLMSLGRDGKPGGVGEDADVSQ